MDLHPDLYATQNLVFKTCGFKYSKPLPELESAEYAAYSFEVNGSPIRFRAAKTTPIKIGQFVTLWKRIANGPIQPYDISDPIDFYIISTRKKDYFGQFVFPKTILEQKNILSKHGKGGKRAIRVYPPWDIPHSPQAKKTQKWQLDYFLTIPQNTSVDCDRAHGLYKAKK
jgi:hypothetical protein